MFRLPRLIFSTLRRTPIRPQFSTSRHLLKNYEGDGKTTITALNKEYQNIIMIDTYSKNGFRLNNGVFVVGPVAAFPRTVLQWNVADPEDITPQSLSLFALLEPRLDFLVIGTGDKKVLPKKEVLALFKDLKICVEVMKTDDAIAIFNFLNVEGRCIAGAFIPPDQVTLYDEEILLKDSHPGLGSAGYLT